MTARYAALLGHPVGHSVSPAMQNAAFEHVGLPWQFLAFDVQPQALQAAVHGLHALGFGGANVTVPHKQAVIPFCDAVDDDVKRVGACNTLVLRDGRAEGHNTDIAGFVEALRDAFGQGVLEGARVVVVGAGGAARAVLAGCLQGRAASMVVLNRSVERAARLVQAIAADGGAASVSFMALAPDTFARAIANADVVVQTTSAGMAPAVDTTPVEWPADSAARLCVFDLVYNPRETRFMREAASRGARVVDGLGMLVSQGARAFELWTGREAPREVMRRAAEEAVRSRPA